MANAWVGIASTTITKHLPDVIDATMRDNKLLAMLENRGRIKFSDSGKDVDWRIEFFQPPAVGYTDGGTIDYARHNKYKVLTLDWRSTVVTDMITEMEMEMNKGKEAIIKRVSTMADGLFKSIKQQFATDLYVDGNAAGNETKIHGCNSWSGSGTTVAADKIAQPSDTYAGLNTALAAAGGTWTSALATSPNAAVATDWPFGTGDSQYDYNSPRLVNFSSTSWGTGSTTYEDNCERAIGDAIVWANTLSGKDGQLDMILHATNLYSQLKNKLRALQRINVDASGSLRSLGFTDVINMDGVECTSEYGVPASTAFGLNVDQMELRSLKSDLFFNKDATYDPRTLGYLFLVGFFGNMTFNVKSQVKFAAYA